MSLDHLGEELTDSSDVYAVVVENLTFGYKKEKILNNLSIRIKQGQIFALLGSNGCGKTTVLKMILGSVKPEKGSILVLGQTPGHKHSMIPGPAVGYMPQEIGLMNNLTIEENMNFFAKIFHLNSKQFAKRLKELTQLLNLCEKSRTLNQLSGGQQRLVSIAVAIIHRPKLIILDEPTVGVDPILRQRVWSYLRDTCRQNGNTVIITTHYIEEAKRASNVGFMKSGAILRQSNPQKLMCEYQCPTLEAVYLHLWNQTDQQLKCETLRKVDTDSNLMLNLIMEKTDKNSLIESKTFLDFSRVMALIWKFNLRFRKLPFIFIIFMAIPVISFLSIYLAIGLLPNAIQVAVHSEEPQPMLSKQFIDSIDDNILNVIHYDSKDSAIDSLFEGKTVFAIFFDKNFTENFKSRILNPFVMTGEEEEDNSVIKLFTDNSRPMILLNGLQCLAQVLQLFMTNVSISLGLNSNAYALPLTIEQPIYGSHPLTGKNRDKYRVNYDNLVPGFLIVIFHLISVVFSSFIVLNNRRDSHMNRFLISGGKPIELIVAHYLSVMVNILIQVFLLLLFGSYLFDFKQEGSYAEVYILCVLQSLQGLSIGLLVALPFKDELTVVTIVTLLVFPLYYISGVFWPLEGIPSYFRVFADWTPLSKPINSLRSIMLRGWDYRHPNVLIGYVVSISYTLVISIFSFVLFQIHQEPFI